MWSVNLDASISGEYQTIGGHSGVAEIPDQEIAHGSFGRKLRKWRSHFEEHREGVAAAR